MLSQLGINEKILAMVLLSSPWVIAFLMSTKHACINYVTFPACGI